MELRQLRRSETVYGLGTTHFLDDGAGRHTLFTHLDNLTYCDRSGWLNVNVAHPPNRVTELRSIVPVAIFEKVLIIFRFPSRVKTNLASPKIVHSLCSQCSSSPNSCQRKSLEAKLPF